MPRVKKPEPTKDHYHHGDLRQALLKSAITHIRANGVHNLSLRDLAREIGVSHTAPYRHFVDKEALLVTLAEEGYVRLISSIKDAINSSTEIAVQVENMAWTYVHFFISNTVHAQIMFGSELAERTRFPTLEKASDEIFALAQNVMENGQRQNKVVKGSTALLTATAWSTVHGLSVLLSSQRLHKNAEKLLKPEELTRQAIRTLLSGILAA